jgi:hypothetical protein
LPSRKRTFHRWVYALPRNPKLAEYTRIRLSLQTPNSCTFMCYACSAPGRKSGTER